MSKLIVANWKMQLSHNESVAWIDNNLPALERSLQQASNKLVLCPSFTVLSYINSLNPKNVLWGAQDCGFEAKGAFTGDVSAASLKELNCSYGIVGHSERRLYYHETDEMTAQKAEQLIKVGIEPIICIGETAQERHDQKTEFVLEKQLHAFFSLLENDRKKSSVTFAYEPIWAISTMHDPRDSKNFFDANFNEINKTITWLTVFLSQRFKGVNCKLLYGGTIDLAHLEHIKEISVDGFLIGHASIDASFMKKICTL